MIDVSFPDPEAHKQWIRHKNGTMQDYDKRDLLSRVSRCAEADDFVGALGVLFRDKSFIHDHEDFDSMLRLKLVQCFVSGNHQELAVRFTKECCGVEPLHILQWYSQRCPGEQAKGGPVLSAAAVAATLNNLLNTNTFTG
jgi:hypothetical protein